MTKAITTLVVFFAFVSCVSRASAAPAPNVTITGSNVTMPSTGTATFPFTLTSVNGFAGNLVVNCTPPTIAAAVRLPFFAIAGPVRSYPLTANASVTGSIGVLSAVPVAVPVRWNRPPSTHRTLWSLAGLLILGLGLRKKRANATRLLLTICMLITLTSLGACGSGPTLTPGTYTYTLSASTITQTAPSLTSATTVTLTVPPGIPTN